MTQDEFLIWWGYHSAAFPNLRAWMSEETKTALIDYRKHVENPTAELPRECKPMTAWSRVLADVDLPAAREATDAILAGDIEKPRAWSDHPAAVRKWARDRATATIEQTRSRRIIDGVETYRCPDCLDTGFVLVLSPASRSLQAAVSCVVACYCDFGDQEQAKRENARRNPLVRYDASRMFRLEDNLPPDPVAFDEWSREREKAAPNYEPAFDTWNDGGF
jgi:hypothetical protein